MASCERDMPLVTENTFMREALDEELVRVDTASFFLSLSSILDEGDLVNHRSSSSSVFTIRWVCLELLSSWACVHF